MGVERSLPLEQIPAALRADSHLRDKEQCILNSQNSALQAGLSLAPLRFAQEGPSRFSQPGRRGEMVYVSLEQFMYRPARAAHALGL